ncbi:GNAT family N-acetyltransferase [Paenibacillus shunpengii]|uniref:GNAT family N-acetyltransferase n=1 Tax=Paenibacillus shunpengii TaxID=2054424 RepID=A0ABW5SQH7_9BACL|nr:MULTISPECIES: GNAT family N-acetyltransferase [unclassified Paenibacillus]OMC68486.1 N-acetyltransferase [Paenibacillus sp. FSL H7-0326]SDW60620.1 Ribosomal protein S18 acetylase RimI [Paenibacillus sp. PDC88]
MLSNVEAPVLTIRSCEKQDAECVTHLMHEVSYPTTPGVMRERIESAQVNDNTCMLVAEMDGEVVGMLGLQCVQSHSDPEQAAQITSLIVCKAHRGEGIGRRLLEHAESWASEHGSQKLLIIEGNREQHKPSYSFYEHLGFTKHGYRFSKKL